MPARSKTILGPLCCLIFGALIESSGLRISQLHSECLRKCRLDRRVGAKTSMQISRSTLSCNEQCLLERQAPHGLIGEAIKQRRRKSLQNTSEATKSSTKCPSPIRAPPSSDWTPSEVYVVFGQYANTPYWYVNATWTSMNDSLGNWDGILIRLSVEIPNIVVDPVYCYVLLKNQTFFTGNISSLGYQHQRPIFLRVTGLPYTDWVSPIQLYLPQTSHISNSNTFHTAAPTSLPNDIAVYVSISIGVVIGIVVVAVLVALLKHFVCHRKTILLPEEFDYDAFIIYNREDQLWVTEKLLPLLEERYSLKCCVHFRDFAPGKPFHETMAECVYKSYKIIAVLSNNFLKSNYCNYELNIAKYRLLDRRDDSLIMIRIDGVDSNKLPRQLRKRNFIDYYSLFERPFWEQKLLRFLNTENGDFPTESVASQPDFGHGNSNHSNDCGEAGKIGFSRPNSTNSNVTEVSVVTSTDDETAE